LAVVAGVVGFTFSFLQFEQPLQQFAAALFGAKPQERPHEDLKNAR
jgi:hypothetical protein